MKELFRTVFRIPDSPFPIDYRSRLFFAGSCFTEMMSQRLQRLKFQVYANPFGILYNPVSLFTMFTRVAGQQIYKEDELIQAGDKWISLDHHGALAGASAEDTLRRINKQIIDAHQFLLQSTHILITLGTAFVYRYKPTDQIAGNCHKLPQQDFERTFLSFSAVENALHGILDLMDKIDTVQSIVFTVSPVRHWREGAVENQRSKSILHTAIHQTISGRENAFYFPAYELLMDDLRDYRFYAPDMLHPSDVASAYIFRHFCDSSIQQSCNPIMDDIQGLHQLLGHKPLSNNKKEVSAFYQSLQNKAEEMAMKYPLLDWEKEKEEIRLKRMLYT